MCKKILSWFYKYIAIPRHSLLLVPIILLDSIITTSCMNLALYLTKVKQFSILDIGETISMYYIGCFLGSFMGGSLTTKYSSVNLSCISSILLGGIYINLLYINNPLNMKLCMFIVGVLVYVLSVSNVTNLLKPAKDKNTKLKLISTELILFNISYSISATVLLILDFNQINSVLISIGILLIFLGIITFYLLRTNPIFNQNHVYEEIKSNRIINIKKLIIVLSSVVVIGLIFSSIKVIYTPTIQERFGSTGLAVIIASINPWLIFLIQPIVIEKIKNMNNILMMGFGGLGIGVGYCAFGFSSLFYTSSICLVVMTIGEILFSPLSKSLVVSQFDSNCDGLALGLWRGVFMGSGFIGPLVSGYLSHQFGNIAVWRLCGILGLICFLLSILVQRIEHLSINKSIKKCSF
ncbi:TPA: MFS transporter [Legionella pneumophila]